MIWYGSSRGYIGGIAQWSERKPRELTIGEITKFGVIESVGSWDNDVHV